MLHYKNKKRGFTLVELIVVLVDSGDPRGAADSGTDRIY